MAHIRFAALLVLLAARPVSAAPPVEGDSRATPGAPQHCPVLFGDGETLAYNATFRARRIDWIDEDDGGVTIVHTSQRWGAEPYRLRIRGLKLVRVRDGAAVFEMSPAVAARTGCVAGSYRVAADSVLSRRTRILAVLSHVVLVEHRGRLAYIAPTSVSAPRWLMAWRMEGELLAIKGVVLHGFRARIY